jgi:hypothetical protein
MRCGAAPLGSDERFSQVEANVLKPAASDDQSYRDTIRLELRWTGWKVGSISAGPSSTTDLILIVQRSCLPGPVDLGRCAVYSAFVRRGANPRRE